ncbi:anti-sigma factor domain-containing protein [Streptomyces sp. NPDC058695]|uniref:anti-sigma factor n=1 Tax=Streptomyces sp. NPDC058695 TaxID=3346604 RepID=UPI00365238D0
MELSDPHSSAGAAYALDALDADERAAFEEHLATCPDCRQEVAEFAATAGRLALASGVNPPPELKQSVLQQITRIRQEPPRTEPEPQVARSSGRSALWMRRWMLAACIVAAALGGAAIWQHQEARKAQNQADRAQAGAARMAAVLGAPDATAHATSLPDGARGVVVASKSQNRAVFTASGLTTPPEGKVYELWFDDHGTMRPAGLLNPGRSNQITLMDGALDQAGGVGITVEPVGGSKTPTLPPVGLIEFPA